MRYMEITAVLAIALLSVRQASAGEPAPLCVHHQVLRETPAKCRDKVKLARVQFNAKPGLQDFDGFLFSVSPHGDTFAVHCLARPNIPNESWLVIAVGATTD